MRLVFLKLLIILLLQFVNAGIVIFKFMCEDIKKVLSEKEYKTIENYCNRLKCNNVPIILNFRHLRKLLKIKKSEQNYYFGENKKNMYKTFPLIKKNGKVRIIDAPTIDLKVRQKWIKRNIIDKIKVSHVAFGFIKKRSICDNAKMHINQKVVVNIDLKDFFPSISYSQVFKIFRYIGYSYRISHYLTKLCTNYNFVLPQGAPTSPGISNIVLLKLDKRLLSLAKKYGFLYSRYADDLTFSGDENILKYIKVIKKIIFDEGYNINANKFRVQFNNSRQVVTGLVVNKKLTIPQKIRNELDLALYYINKFGLQNHLDKINCQKAFYKEHLYGLAYYSKMVDSNIGNSYLDKLGLLNWNS